MNLREGARSLLRRSETRLDAARRSLARGELPEVVRFSQEATEYALKAALRLVGVEYPKRHDPSEAVLAHSERFPEWFRADVGWFADLCRELSQNRQLAVYGDERRGRTAEALFSDRKQVEGWAKGAGRLYELVVRLDRTTAAVEQPAGSGRKPPKARPRDRPR